LAFAVQGRKQRAAPAINLNTDGMFMAAERLFPVGTVLLLELTVPGFAEKVSCQCRVAWVNHPEWCKKTALSSGMGVQFLDLPAHVGEVLRSYLDSLTVKS
jgi:Tfp pilus assembly protein PilZ